MSKVFLIDFENTGPCGLSGCDKLDETDKIITFFTQQCNKIDMRDIAEIKPALEFIEVPLGKQSVDWHIVTYLGFLVAHENANKEISIISQDKGYDPLIPFWAKRSHKTIKRCNNIGNAIKKK